MVHGTSHVNWYCSLCSRHTSQSIVPMVTDPSPSINFQLTIRGFQSLTLVRPTIGFTTGWALHSLPLPPIALGTHWDYHLAVNIRRSTYHTVQITFLSRLLHFFIHNLVLLIQHTLLWDMFIFCFCVFIAYPLPSTIKYYFFDDLKCKENLVHLCL